MSVSTVYYTIYLLMLFLALPYLILYIIHIDIIYLLYFDYLLVIIMY